MTDTSRRVLLSHFLKDRRARVTPSDVGLPEPKRSRTPGLRREDVATLTGMSVTWYTYLEQGRDVKASEEALDRIARLLRLSPVEREYLFELVRQRPAPPLRDQIDDVPAATERLLHAVRVPAYVLTTRWDVVAWNTAAEQMLCDFSAWPDDQRNLLKLVFSGKVAGSNDLETRRVMARRFVAKLKLDFSRMSSDSLLNDLVEELGARHPLFREFWETADVSGLSDGASRIEHPTLGGIELEHTSYVPEGSPTLRVVVLTPKDGDAARKLEAAMTGRLTKPQAASALSGRRAQGNARASQSVGGTRARGDC